MSVIPTGAWPPAEYPLDDRYGRASIAPVEPVVAASYGTWSVTYVAGMYGIDDAGGLRIVFENNSDFGAPQFTDPRAPNFCTLAWNTPAPCYLEAHYQHELGVRPFKRGLQVSVRDQAVRPGDTLTVTFGDTSQGSPGAAMQTMAGRLRANVLLDAHGTGVYVPVGPLQLPVLAGAPDHLRVHAPSDVVQDAPFDVVVVGRDRWGNAAFHRRERVTLSVPGVQTVPVHDPASGLNAQSNPTRCRPAGAKAAWQVYWGDLHAQTEETGGAGSLDEYFTYARQCAAIDFTGHQANDYQVSDAAWEHIMAKTQEYDGANGLITFAGYEWSGNTPGGGDHNVHFKGGDQQRWTLHRSSHWQVEDKQGLENDRFPVSRLYDTFRGRDDVLLIPHVGGRYANLREYFDESLMPLVEICSCWGIFEWFAADAFERGTVFGFSAGSDDHTARPGMSFAAPGQFSTGGGLTAVLATERSREGIWDAIRARRAYATTGQRILLDVNAIVDGQHHPMGSLVESNGLPVEISVKVHGTAPLWRVELLRWPDVVYRHPLHLAPQPEALTSGASGTAGTSGTSGTSGIPGTSIAPGTSSASGRHRLRIGWAGARIRARRRQTRWDGQVRLTAGRIVGVEGWGFDRPDHGVVEHGERHARWQSVTAGDWDGVVLDVECPDHATIHFETGPATFSFTPGDVQNRPLEVDAGGVGQRVVVETDPGPDQTRSASFTYRDPAPVSGRHPYYVRVTQQDGHMAWSSPIFITSP